jgi:hypothetical protein
LPVHDPAFVLAGESQVHTEVTVMHHSRYFLAATTAFLLAVVTSGAFGRSAFDGAGGPSEDVNYHPEEHLYSLLRTRGSFQHPQGRYTLLVQGVRGQKLVKPTFKWLDARGNVTGVTQAEEGDLHVDLANKTILIHLRLGHAHTDEGSVVVFKERVLEIPLPGSFPSR